jgi:hypothetical protein
VGEIVVPTQSAEDWRHLLGDPEKHWRTRYSAKALAFCWEAAKGDFPPSVRKVFDHDAPDAFRRVELLLAKPEHRVALPGRGYPSQTDLFVLAKSGDDLVSIAVEGKVSEPFDLLVLEWLTRPTRTAERDADVDADDAAPSQPRPGKLQRLECLCEMLGIDRDAAEQVRYQLVHRTAAALIEATRFNTRHAVMLVHSFSQQKPPEWFDDYQRFASLTETRVAPNAVAHVGKRKGIELYLGWVTGESQFLDS